MQKLTLQKPARATLFAGGMYFGYYFALGTFMPYINLYFERIGLSGVQIGSLTALPVLVVSATSLLWGTVADAFRWHKKILSIALLLTPLAVLLIPRTNEFVLLIPIILAYAFFGSPIVPLLDSSALEIAKTSGSSYGQLRVWGSIGWSVSTWLIGASIERTDIRIFFYLYAIFMGVLLLASFIQPGRVYTNLNPSLKLNFRGFLRFDIVIFLVSIYLISTTSGVVYAFFSIYMDRIGAGEGMIGLGWSLGSLTEIPVMLFSALLLRRIGAAGLLKISFVTYMVRWFLFSFITQPELALMVQLLHGLSFGMFLVGSVTFLSERAPLGMETTAQAIFSTVTFGFGSITGAMLGGYLLDRVGISNLFVVLSGISLAGFLLFNFAGNFRERILRLA